MDEFDPAPPPQEQQLTHEDRARLAVQRVYTLSQEALEQPNSTAMDEHAKTRPSRVIPILDANGHKIEQIEVTSRGLSGKPNSDGKFLTRMQYSTDGDSGLQSLDTSSSQKYWINYSMDLNRQKLHKLSRPQPGKSMFESDNLEECGPIETLEVMEEFRDILEGALHPDKQASRKRLHEIADASSSAASKRRGGFLMRLARKVFDPSKVFPKNRTK